jgi:hypothetical protein
MTEPGIRPKIMGLALGLFWGVTLFLWTLISVMTGYSYELLTLLSSVYPGYGVSIKGSIAGLAYGFMDGFVSGFIFAWIYVNLAKRL